MLVAGPRNGNVLFSLLSSSTGPSPGLKNILSVISYCSCLGLVPLKNVGSGALGSLCTEKPRLSPNSDRPFCVESKKRKRGRIVGKHAAVIAMFISRLFLTLIRKMRYKSSPDKILPSPYSEGYRSIFSHCQNRSLCSTYCVVHTSIIFTSIKAWEKRRPH